MDLVSQIKRVETYLDPHNNEHGNNMAVVEFNNNLLVKYNVSPRLNFSMDFEQKSHVSYRILNGSTPGEQTEVLSRKSMHLDDPYTYLVGDLCRVIDEKTGIKDFRTKLIEGVHEQLDESVQERSLTPVYARNSMRVLTGVVRSVFAIPAWVVAPAVIGGSILYDHVRSDEPVEIDTSNQRGVAEAAADFALGAYAYALFSPFSLVNRVGNLRRTKSDYNQGSIRAGKPVRHHREYMVAQDVSRIQREPTKKSIAIEFEEFVWRQDRNVHKKGKPNRFTSFKLVLPNGAVIGDYSRSLLDAESQKVSKDNSSKAKYHFECDEGLWALVQNLMQRPELNPAHDNTFNSATANDHLKLVRHLGLVQEHRFEAYYG